MGTGEEAEESKTDDSEFENVPKNVTERIKEEGKTKACNIF